MVRHLFGRGNTARGVHCLYDSAFQGLRKIYLLTGAPGCGKSTLLQRVADFAAAQGQAAELFHSPLNPAEVDALILPALQVGVADARMCLGLESVAGAELVRIDLGRAVDDARVPGDVSALQDQESLALASAYETFAEALRIHDEWEAYYIGAMDFERANQVGTELIDELFGSGQSIEGRTPQVRHLFFGAATPQGAVDHIQSLTSHLPRRIFIKGRPGSGKSTLLKRLAQAAEASGHDVEVFHCGFDPNSLDMLIFPGLSVCIFDSTAPHEYFPSQSSDEILDMYERTMAPGTDEQYAEQIQAIQQRYSQKMKEAMAFLKVAQGLHEHIRAAYAGATDFAVVERLGDGLLADLAN